MNILIVEPAAAVASMRDVTVQDSSNVRFAMAQVFVSSVMEPEKDNRKTSFILR